MPTCPYCGELVSGPMTMYGGEMMHRACYLAFGAEMEQISQCDFDEANTGLLEVAEARFAEDFQLV